jgi:hypothetical protein
MSHDTIFLQHCRVDYGSFYYLPIIHLRLSHVIGILERKSNWFKSGLCLTKVGISRISLSHINSLNICPDVYAFKIGLLHT